MTAKPFAQAFDIWLARLHQSGRLRVWSVVVTIFGDTIIQRGGIVSAATLQELATRLGIEPGALRTAISRLVRDGWITRLKSGRTNSYQLTSNAARVGFEAARVIYAATPQAPTRGYQLALLPQPETRPGEDDSALFTNAGFVQISPGAWLGPASGHLTEVPTDTANILMANVAAGNLPSWVIARITPPETAAALAELLHQAENLIQAFREGGADPLDATAARVVLIHEWRRIALRQAQAGSAILGPDWPGESCRSGVSALYHLLLAASALWLDTRPELSPASGDDEAGRFGRPSG
ncbi:MAG: PaaX family transcriptional regulator C-terminal domain-containing protein [Nitratireductor sp.]